MLQVVKGLARVSSNASDKAASDGNGSNNDSNNISRPPYETSCSSYTKTKWVPHGAMQDDEEVEVEKPEPIWWEGLEPELQAKGKQLEDAKHRLTAEQFADRLELLLGRRQVERVSRSGGGRVGDSRPRIVYYHDFSSDDDDEEAAADSDDGEPADGGGFD